MSFEQYATDGTCSVCGKGAQVVVCAIPMIPCSDSFCKDCLTAGAIPYWAAVANTACIGGIENANEAWKAIVQATLKHLGKTKEQFKLDVQKDIEEEKAE